MKHFYYILKAMQNCNYGIIMHIASSCFLLLWDSNWERKLLNWVGRAVLYNNFAFDISRRIMDVFCDS